MKNLRISMSAMALILGMSAAFATTASNHRSGTKTWGLNQSTGMYEDVTGQEEGLDFECRSGVTTCTEEYAEDVNPNDQANDQHPGTASPISVETGRFIK